MCPTPPPYTQYMCLIQSANYVQDPYPTAGTLGIKVDEGLLFSVGSPLSWPAVLTVSHSSTLFPSHSVSCLEILFQPAPRPRQIRES